MTVFGGNLLVLAREVGAEVKQIGMYGYGTDSVSLYDTDALGTFLNLPAKAYANFQAWFTIPGDNLGWRTGVAPVHFLDRQWKIPNAVGRKVPNGCKDLFSYLSRSYFKSVKEAAEKRLFDLVYSASCLNGVDMKEFVEATAVKL